MSSNVRSSRTARVAFALATVVALCATQASPASAAPIFPVDWQVDAVTHLKTLDQDVVIPTGSFKGSVDLGTGQLTGDIVLPEASATIKLSKFQLAKTTVKMTQTRPVTGQIDLATLTAEVDASIDLRMTRLELLGLPFNVIGNRCRSVAPLDVQLSGPVKLDGASTWSTEYTIPKLRDCGLLTPILNLIVPGSGNTFEMTLGPKTA